MVRNGTCPNETARLLRSHGWDRISVMVKRFVGLSESMPTPRLAEAPSACAKVGWVESVGTRRRLGGPPNAR